MFIFTRVQIKSYLCVKLCRSLAYIVKLINDHCYIQDEVFKMIYLANQVNGLYQLMMDAILQYQTNLASIHDLKTANTLNTTHHNHPIHVSSLWSFMLGH